MQFPVGFYLVALIFIVFDTLAVFLFPWALSIRALGVAGLKTMGLFRGDPGARLGLRVSGGDPRVEIKPPVPVVPAPVWKDFKDLQEWEALHKNAARDR